MTKQQIRNVSASVNDRLLNHSHDSGEDFQFVLQRYGAERFLYRLGESAHRGFVVRVTTAPRLNSTIGSRFMAFGLRPGAVTPALFVAGAQQNAWVCPSASS